MDSLSYVFVAATVELVVSILRRYISALDGRLVNLTAWLVGFGATYAPIPTFAALDGLDARLAAGAVLAGVASFVAETKQRLEGASVG